MTMREELEALRDRWREFGRDPQNETWPAGFAEAKHRDADQLDTILARYADYMSLRADVAEAVFSRLRLYEIAESSCPEVPVSQVRDCACTGPAGYCCCMMEQRLVDEFRDAMIQAAQKVEGE